jgi:hypothetical protein
MKALADIRISCSLALYLPRQFVCKWVFSQETELIYTNRLAHWEGLQPYSDEDTSRGNLVSECVLFWEYNLI